MQITAGKYRSRKIETPNSDLVKPTLSKTRESVFNILNSLLNFENSSFLDLFSGSGIMSLEAISRGFKPVVAIEKNPRAFKIIKENYKTLALRPNLYTGDALRVLPKLNQKFDVIYVDPPYDTDLYEKVLNTIKEKNLLTENGHIILESDYRKDFEQLPFEIIKQKVYGKHKLTVLKNF